MSRLVWETDTISRAGNRQELFVEFNNGYRLRVAHVDCNEADEWESHCAMRDGHKIFNNIELAKLECYNFVVFWHTSLLAAGPLAQHTDEG